LDGRHHPQPGLLVKGATVERTAKFLGRTFDYGYVVTRHEPARLVELKVDRPFPMLVRYELEDAAAGTLVAIHASGAPGGFFGRVASPVMGRQVRKRCARASPRTWSGCAPAWRPEQGCQCPAASWVHIRTTDQGRAPWPMTSG
jgi:hypothetical protein